MKIVLATGIYPPDAGGPATYTRALARAFVHAGHTVQVVCYGAEDGVFVDETGFPVITIARTWLLPMRYWLFMCAVRRAAAVSSVVYLQGPGSEGFPGTLGALLARKPTVMKVVGDYAWEIYAGSGGTELLDAFLQRRHFGKVGMLEWIERWTTKRATRVIVPSRYLGEVVKKWGVATERVQLIYNAVEPSTDGVTEDRDALRQTLGVSGKRVMLSPVRAVPWKGGAFLVGLVKDLAEDMVLVIAGDGPELATWKRVAEQEGVTDRVRFLGRVPREAMHQWYTAADVCVLASGYEGFPWVIVEAAAAGLPSIVSDRGGNPETLELLGASTVRVRPYLDRAAWIAALNNPWPPRVPAVLPDVLRAEVMVRDTEKLLLSYVS